MRYVQEVALLGFAKAIIFNFATFFLKFELQGQCPSTFTLPEEFDEVFP